MNRHAEAGLKFCLENGVTAVHTNEENCWQAYCQLAEQNKLPIRVFYVGYFSIRKSEDFPEYPGVKKGPFLSSDRTKLFVDGSLGAHTAALSKPYVGGTNTGLFIHPKVSF